MNYSKQEFERLFKDSYPHMYRMAFSMVENADDAKDAVHQVFAQIWRNKPRVANNSIRGYLLAATRNQCLHLLRSGSVAIVRGWTDTPSYPNNTTKRNIFAMKCVPLHHGKEE